MDIVFFGAIVAMLVYITYKNFTVLSRYKYNKKYIQMYQGILNNTDTAHDDVEKFVSSCKSDEYKCKGNILKLFCELEKGLDYSEVLNTIDFKTLFYKKGKYAPSQLRLNCDSLVFVILTMAKAHKKKKKDVIKTLMEKLDEIDGIKNNVEYLECKAVYESLLKKEDSGVSFFNGMLDGEYAGLKYEKNLIGLYKRIASSMLAYNKASMDEYFLNDLSKFASTIIGRTFMQDLNIYNKFNKSEE